MPPAEGFLETKRAALRALQAGRILVVFPEGRIATADELLPFHVGVAMMAIKARVPIYPKLVHGPWRWLKWALLIAMLALVDKLILIDKGRLVAYGPKDEVISKLQARQYGTQAENTEV